MSSVSIFIEIWPLLLAGALCLAAILLICIFFRSVQKPFNVEAPEIPERTTSTKLGSPRKDSVLSVLSTTSFENEDIKQGESTLLRMMRQNTFPGETTVSTEFCN
jgi:hypothetical protein